MHIDDGIIMLAKNAPQGLEHWVSRMIPVFQVTLLLQYYWFLGYFTTLFQLEKSENIFVNEE
jgi:hypothetical protein